MKKTGHTNRTYERLTRLSNGQLGAQLSLGATPEERGVIQEIVMERVQGLADSAISGDLKAALFGLGIDLDEWRPQK